MSIREQKRHNRARSQATSQAVDAELAGPDKHADVERSQAAQAEAHAAERRASVATAAYFRALRRGFEPGHELDDWLAAEAELAQVQVSAVHPGN